MKQVRMYRVELVRESSKLYDIDTTMSSSSKAPKVLKEIFEIEKWHNEKFGMVCLDNQNKIVGVHIIFEGTVNETPIYVREVATRALLNNATSVILFHNHPGESTTPSMADIQATKNIQKALEILNITVIDHIILTLESHKSFVESGLL